MATYLGLANRLNGNMLKELEEDNTTVSMAEVLDFFSVNLARSLAQSPLLLIDSPIRGT